MTSWRRPNWGSQNTQQRTQIPPATRKLSWLPRATSLEEPSRWAFQFLLLMMRGLAGPMAGCMRVVVVCFFFAMVWFSEVLSKSVNQLRNMRVLLCSKATGQLNTLLKEEKQVMFDFLTFETEAWTPLSSISFVRVACTCGADQRRAGLGERGRS